MKKVLTIAALLFASIAGTAVAADKYDVKIEKPTAKASAKAVAKVQVTPKGEYHMNKEYPTKLTLKPVEGVKFESEKLTAKDNKDAVKVEDGATTVQISFTSDTAGKKTITGELKGAVCKAEECVPFTEKISFDVDVAAK